MESTLRRTWAEIDLDALAHNYRTLRAHVGPAVKFLGVVKADGYGHGAIQVSRTLEALGADYLAVSSIDEAMELRHNGIAMPILILGHTPREQVGRLIDLHITQAVSCQAKALEYSEEAVRCGGELTVHIKVDTGMSRLGYLVSGRHFNTGTADICAACALPGLRAEGIFTHFAVSDEPDADSRDYTEKQLALFRRVIDAVEAKRGQRFAIRHCANSGGVASYPETYMDMVRPGILLYGCGDLAEKLGLHPVMALKTTVSTIKTYEPGTDVSYGRRFTTERVTRMGVVPYGYADGFHRCLSDRCGFMTAEGMAPQRGRICMDMSMIDLTDLPGVQVGDEVEVEVLDPEKFATVLIHVRGRDDGTKYIVQLLDGSNALKQEKRDVTTGDIRFNYVPAGEIKFRVIEDRNGNGKWDSGNVVERLQPERAEIYANDQGEDTFATKTTWEIEFSMDMNRIFAPVTMQSLSRLLDERESQRLRREAEKRAKEGPKRDQDRNRQQNDNNSNFNAAGGMFNNFR